MATTATDESTRPTLLLVHGAWHGPWCWEHLIPLLHDHGWRTRTVALPSSRQNQTAATTSTPGLEDDVLAILDELAAVDGPAILVSHSYGGAPATQAAARADNVVRLVYIAAFQLDVGESVRTSMGADASLPIPEDGYSPPHLGADFFTDVPEDVAARAARRLGLQSDPSRAQRLTAAGWHHIPSTYVICDRDGAVAPTRQERFAERATSVHRLNTGHSPFYSTPRALAALLCRIAREANTARPAT